MMRILLILCACLLSSKALSATYVNGRGERVVAYVEDGVWILDRFAVEEDGWTDLVSHEEFASAADQKRAMQAEQQNVQFQLAAAKTPRRKRRTSHGGLWTVKNEWNTDWEDKYSEWIAKELRADFFQSIGFPTTCSDVAYVLRWVFARENALPAANRLTSGELFTQAMMRSKWAGLPTAADWKEDKRFIEALKYLSRNTYTHTLFKDSYPVRIALPALSTGAYHVNKEQDYGHTMIVYKVGILPDEIPLLTLSSTTPRAVRLLNEYMYVEKVADPKKLGLLRMRWPVVSKGRVSILEPEKHPYFSDEQFAPDFITAPRTQFWEEVFYRLNPNLDYAKVAVILLDQLGRMFRDRVGIVEQGYAECARGECPEGTQNWEDWSTPNRDARILATIGVFDQVVGQTSDLRKVNQLLESPTVEIEGRSLTLFELNKMWREKLFVSDPKEPVARRWGL